MKQLLFRAVQIGVPFAVGLVVFRFVDAFMLSLVASAYLGWLASAMVAGLCATVAGSAVAGVLWKR